jgi:hypothetical protein
MMFDKRITLGNLLTILSFFFIGITFALSVSATSVSNRESIDILVPKVDANTQAVLRLEEKSADRADDIQYITDVVKAIADKVDAKIPIKDPSK